MNGTRLFDVDTRIEPRFEYIKSVRIVEEEKQDYEWLWEKLVELPSGCWVWTGRHTERGFPVRDNVSPRSRYERYVQRKAWEAIRGEKRLFGTIEQRCGRTGCCNPAHFKIIY